MAVTGKGRPLRSAWYFKRKPFAKADLYHQEFFGVVNKTDSIAWGDWFFPSTSGLQLFSAGDALAATEAFLKRVDKLFTDALSATEGFAKQLNRTAADAAVFTENLTVTKVALQAIGDAGSFTENFAKQVNKRVAESAVLTEAFSKQLNRTVADTAVLSESFTKQLNRSVADTVFLNESVGIRALKQWAESVNLSENFSFVVIGGSGGVAQAAGLHIGIRVGLP